MKQQCTYQNKYQIVTGIEIYQHKEYHDQGKYTCNVECQSLRCIRLHYTNLEPPNVENYY